MKDLILIVDGKKYQYDTAKELVQALIDKNYYDLNDEEKREKLKQKAFVSCMIDKIEIIDQIDKHTSYKDKFIAIDEITYIYSLLVFDKIMLLESTKANIFTEQMDKTQIVDNYIIVNKFANSLLKEYLENKIGG